MKHDIGKVHNCDWMQNELPDKSVQHFNRLTRTFIEIMLITLAMFGNMSYLCDNKNDLIL